MKKGLKKNLPSFRRESEEEEETISNPIASLEYITDLTDKIDIMIEEANKLPRKEKKEKLTEVCKLMKVYEDYVGRKIFTYPL